MPTFARFYFRLLVLAFTAVLAHPALAQQQGPLFSRADYNLDYSISGSTGLIVADLNNDGRLDFVVGAGYGIDVAMGNGDGTFQPFKSFVPTGAGVNALATLASFAADFDGDGNPDLVVYSDAGVFILPGKGDGTFGPGRAITTASLLSAVQLQAADLNHDGRPDLVILTNNLLPALANATVLLNQGNGTFSSSIAFTFPALESGLVMAIADFNRDGLLDLAIATTIDYGFGASPPVTGHVYIARGKGDGSFFPPVAEEALSQTPSFIAAADFNKDGTPDLAVESGMTFIFLGNGDGSFRTAPSINVCCANPGSIAVADWTKSGNLGLGISTVITPHGIGIEMGNGDGTFYSAETAAMDPRSFPAYQFSSGDLNGDGLPDLVALVGTTVSVFVNAGSSPPLSFVAGSAASGASSVTSASIATIYGKFPVIVTKSSGPLPAPVKLGGVTVTVQDSAGVTRTAPLFYVSPAQINLEIPEDTAPGSVAIMVLSAEPPVLGSALVRNVVPAIFTDGSITFQGSLYPAAYAVTFGPDGKQEPPVLVAACESSGCSAVPIPRPAGSRVFLELYGTGIRHHVSPVIVLLNTGQQGSQTLKPAYAGAQGQFDGQDQVNIEITNLPVVPSYRLVLVVDGLVSNAVMFAVE